MMKSFILAGLFNIVVVVKCINQQRKELFGVGNSFDSLTCTGYAMRNFGPMFYYFSSQVLLYEKKC